MKLLNRSQKSFIIILYFILFSVSFLQLRADDKCDHQAIYFREKGVFYKFDIVQKKVLESNRREYLLNSSVASPDCQWVWERSGNLVYLVNAKGEKLAVDLPDNLIEYSWSPQVDKIAYITGDCIVDPDYGPRCTPHPGVWIYDIKTHTKKKIDINITDHLLAWPEFDGNLYIQTLWRNIMRYNPNTGKIDQTPYKGLNFSPDGKYYFMGSYEGEPCQIYQREPHKELKEIAQDIDKQANTLGHHSWLADGHSLLLSKKKESSTKFIVYDVEKGEVTKTIEGALLGLNKSRSKVLIMKGIDQFEVIDLLSP